ncbi:MAG: glycoside hydrolase family 2 TIM barrel-domain containing protein [Planctomycetota bacterium]
MDTTKHIQDQSIRTQRLGLERVSAWAFAILLAWLLLFTDGVPAHAQTAPGAPEPAVPAEERLDFLRPADQGGSDGATASERATLRVTKGSSEVLPQIRLTPRDVAVPGIADARIDLNGEWDFVHNVPDAFDGRGSSVAAWDAVRVPGHFAFQGFPRMHADFGVPVAYRKAFDVPAGWKNARVVLRFESVDGLSRLWVNGRPAGQNDIATLPSEFDITEYVAPGETNEITLTVETSLVTYWSRRELGGINRGVYVQALPEVNLARLHVDTELNEAGDATLNAHLRIANQSEQSVEGLRVAFSLSDVDDEAAPQVLDPDGVRLRPIAPGQTLELTVPLRVADVQTWTAESPHLYRLTAALERQGSADAPAKTLMSATQRFGFCDVRVVGHELRLNGRPIKLRGTNYHITYPGLGEAVPRELIRGDLERFLDVNFNALRSRPTPDIAYVELCDEMGVYTTVEAMVTLMIYARGVTQDHGANPEIAPGYRNHVATMIESYYSNPSVIAWGLGNECPYYDWFRTAAPGMKHRDPTRPLFFGSDRREGVGTAHMDLNDDHYPRDERIPDGPHYGTGDTQNPRVVHGEGWDYPDDRPNIFTEWMIISGERTKETLYDPGVFEFWAHTADTHIEALYQRPHFVGGFHFKGAPYIGAKEVSWGGVFDARRNPVDLAWHVKKTHSPVRIFDTRGQRDEQRQTVRFDVANRYDFCDLNELTFKWTTEDGATGEAVVQAPARTTGRLILPVSSPRAHRFDLDVIDPPGRTIDRYTLHVPATDALRREQRRALRAERRRAQTQTTTPPAVTETEEAWRIDTPDVRLLVDRSTGLLSAGSLAATDGEVPVLQGPPQLLVLPSLNRGFRNQGEAALTNQANGWQMREARLTEHPDRVIVVAHGNYTDAAGTFTTTLHPDGRVEVAYAFIWTGAADLEVFSAGLALPVGEAFDTLRWDRRARWSWYPEHHIGRAAGQATAAGDAAWNDAREAAAQSTPDQATPPLPWSQQRAADGVTRDFRGTKFNIREAGLHDADGRGLVLLDDGTGLHAQAVPAIGQDGYVLHALNFHRGDSNPHLTKSLRFDQKSIRPGESFAGRVVFQLVDE